MSLIIAELILSIGAGIQLILSVSYANNEAMDKAIYHILFTIFLLMSCFINIYNQNNK